MTSDRRGVRSTRGSARRALLLALLAAAGGAGAQTAEPAAKELAAVPACDNRAPLPTAFHFTFDAQARRGPFSLEGENELLFTREGGRYTFQSRTRSLLFSADQRSSGAVDGSTLVPSEYVEKTARRPARSTRLDWQAGTVHFSASPEVVPTAPLMQDRISMLLHLSTRARAKPSAAIEIQVAGVRHTSLYRFEERGRQPLELPAGRIDTVKFERPMTADNDRIEVWLAPGLCWLPVRARFTDDKGQVIDNQLRRATFD